MKQEAIYINAKAVDVTPCSVTTSPVTARPPAWASVRKIVEELFAYGLVSVVALAVDVSILKSLVDLAHWHYLPASTVAFIAGAGVAYVLSIRYVFRGSGSKQRGLEFLYFVVLGIAGLMVNAVVLSIGIGLIGLGLLASKAVAAMLAFTTNFVLRRSLLFAR